jgi:DNA-3-methyladenine glycosylase I
MSEYCRIAPGHPVHERYHDDEYGVPSRDDAVICERLALEIFQAGLSWELILRRRDGIDAAFAGFAPAHVAAFDEDRRAHLAADPRVIRNRRKIDAIVHNAGVMCALIDEYGSVAAWLDRQHPLPKDAWVRLFRTKVRFTGPEVTNEFLMSLGYLPGAHDPRCPAYARIATLGPAWMSAGPDSPQPKDDA